MRVPDATERKVIVTCFAVSAVICMFPGDFISAGILAIIAVSLLALHRQRTSLEEKAARAAQTGVAAPPTETEPETAAEGATEAATATEAASATETEAAAKPASATETEAAAKPDTELAAEPPTDDTPNADSPSDDAPGDSGDRKA